MDQGIKKYTKTLLDFIGIYIIGSLNVNGKIPKNVKTYSYFQNSNSAGNIGKSDAKQVSSSTTSYY